MKIILENKHKLLITIISLYFTIIFFPINSIAHAQITYTPQVPGLLNATTTFNNTTAPLANYIKNIYNYGIGIVAILATVVMMIGGFQWIIAGGSPEKIGEAKAWIVAAISGLVLALSSYMILAMINPDLVNFRIDKIPLVTQMVTDYLIATGSNVMTKNFSTYDSELAIAAKKTGIDCKVLKAFMYVESTGNPNSNSKPTDQGIAKGLMQLTPGTASSKGLSQADIYDPAKNVLAGAKYIQELLATACNKKTKSYSGAFKICDTTTNDANSLKAIAAAYNGGPKANAPSVNCPGKAAWECTINGKDYEETRNYIPKVITSYNNIKANGWDCGK